MTLPTLPTRGAPVVIRFADAVYTAAVAHRDELAARPDVDPEALTAADRQIPADESFAVTFSTRLLSGAEWEHLQRISPSEDERYRWNMDALAPRVIAAMVTEWQSTSGSHGGPFTEDEARELWQTWPQWARAELWEALYGQIIAGPGADPFGRSNRNGTAAG